MEPAASRNYGLMIIKRNFCVHRSAEVPLLFENGAGKRTPLLSANLAISKPYHPRVNL